MQNATDAQIVDIDEDLEYALKLFDGVLTGDRSIYEAFSDQVDTTIKSRM